MPNQHPGTPMNPGNPSPSQTSGCGGGPAAHKMEPMPSGVSRISFSIRVTPAFAARLRGFIRDNAGRPLYLELGSFVETTLTREIDRIERGQTAPPTSPPRRGPSSGRGG